jgi:hypothetical protein
LDDVRRAQGVIGAYTRTRLEIIAARPGNPMGAEAREFGEAVALRAPGSSGGHFNYGYGFCDEQIEHIPALIEWYAAGAGGSFELAPGREIAQTAKLLAAAGYVQTGFHATFAGPAEMANAPSAGVDVQRVEGEDDLKIFADVYHLGWAITGFRIPMKPWLTAPGWSLYLARCDGEPAGMAIVYVRERTPIWPTARSIRAFAGAACIGPCSIAAATTPARPARPASIPARTSSRPVTATCSVRGWSCSTPRRS